MLREIKAICASQLQLLTQHEYWDVSDCYVKWYLSCRISRRATCPLPSWLWIWWRLRLQGLVGLLSTGRCCRSPYISSHQLRLHEVKGIVHWKFTFYTSTISPMSPWTLLTIYSSWVCQVVACDPTGDPHGSSWTWILYQETSSYFVQKHGHITLLRQFEKLSSEHIGDNK